MRHVTSKMFSQSPKTKRERPLFALFLFLISWCGPAISGRHKDFQSFPPRRIPRHLPGGTKRLIVLFLPGPYLSLNTFPLIWPLCRLNILPYVLRSMGDNATCSPLFLFHYAPAIFVVNPSSNLYRFYQTNQNKVGTQYA